MVRVPTYQGPGLQPTPQVQFESPTVRPMEDVVSPQIQQMGQAMGQLGQGTMEVGTALMRKAQRDQDDLDRADAIRAFTDYKGRVRERLNNDQTGYFRTQGDQAYGANKTVVQEELFKYREEAERSLASPAARQLFSQRADADDIQTFTAMDAHAGDQRNSYVKAQENALVDSEIEDLQKMHGDPQFGERMSALLKGTIPNSMAMRGQSPEAIAAAQKKVEGTVYAGAIENIADKDPVKALEALNTFAKSGALDPKYVTDKRADLQRKADQVIGDVAGYTAWDASKGNGSVARIDLDRQRKEKKLTPSQYEKALQAITIQESSQDQQRAKYENDTLNEAINRLSDPSVTLDSFSEADREKLRKANRWDEVVQFVNQGRQFYDEPAEIRRAEDYLLKVQNGQAQPMSDVEFRRTYRRSMSDQTFNEFASMNGRALAASAREERGGGGGRGKTDAEKQEEELLTVNLQEMLKGQGFNAFEKIDQGITAQLDDTNNGRPTSRAEGGLTLLRFRSYFDPIYQQLRKSGVDGKPMGYGAALQQAFQQVMAMPKGSDGKRDWERVRGTVPAERVTYETSPGVNTALEDYSTQEVDSALSMWERQNPRRVAAGASASPGELVQVMAGARNRIKTATTIQRDSVGGMVSWGTLARQAATIRPGMTEQQVREEILGKVGDNSMGVFRDNGHPVRIHDLVVGYQTATAKSSMAAGASNVTYAPTFAESNAAASDVSESAIGVSLAAANRYFQKLRGENYSLTSDQPASNSMMPLNHATSTMNRLMEWSSSTGPVPGADGNFPMAQATLSEGERRALHLEASSALAALKANSESKNAFRSDNRYNETERSILAFERLVDQLAFPYEEKWTAFDPSNDVLAAEDRMIQGVAQDQPTPAPYEEDLQQDGAVERMDLDASAMLPIGAVQDRNMLPSERILLDQVRATDRMEQAVADLQMDIPGLEVKSGGPSRSKQRAEAIAALRDGNPKLAQKYVDNNQRNIAVATWLYENVIGNLPRIDRSLRDAETQPMQQPQVVEQIPQGQFQRPTNTTPEQLDSLRGRMRAQVEQQPGFPKLLPTERKLYARLTEAFEQRVKLETMLTQDVSPQGQEALRSIRYMQQKVMRGELREAEQFLGSYEQEHTMAVAVQALTVKAMEKLNETSASFGQYASTEIEAAKTRRGLKLKSLKAAMTPSTWQDLLIKGTK